MSEELELATLYSDDRLLDCLAGRSEVPDADLVAGLLAAFAADVDTYPVMLADATLVSVGSHPAFGAGPLPAAKVAAAAEAMQADEAEEPGEGTLTLPISRKRRHLMLPRTAAAATAMVVVLGVGGAAAAVGGNVGPLQHFKSAVISVTDKVAPGHSREDRVANLLNDAHVALRTGDLREASEKAGRARLQLTGLTGPVAEALQDELITVLARIQSASQRIALAAANAGIPGGSTIAGHHSSTDRTTARSSGAGAAPGSPSATSDASVAAAAGHAASPSATPTHHGLSDRLEDTGVPGAADKLPKAVPGEPGIGDAKERLKDKAKEQLDGVPDEIQGPVGPVAPWRHPASEGIFDNPAYSRIIGGLGGDALSHSDPSAVAGGLTGGAVSPR